MNKIYDLSLTSDLVPVTGSTIPSFSRASDVWLRNDNGVYIRFGAGAPAINKNGILCEPARVNRCANYNSEPDISRINIGVSAGKVVRVLRTQQLKKAGLGNICSSGYAWRLKNMSGSDITVTIGGAAVSTNAAAISLFAWVIGSACTIQLTGGKGAISISPNNGFERFISESIGEINGSEQFQIVVPNAASIEWVLNQLESGANATIACVTSPMKTSGAPSSRAATIFSISGSVLPSNNFAVSMEVMSHTVNGDSGNPAVLHAYLDNNNRIILTTGVALLERKVSGTSYTACIKHGQQLSPVTYAFICDSNFGIFAFSNGAQGYTSSATSLALQATTIYLGARQDGSQAFCGQIKNIKVFTGINSLVDVKLLTSGNELETADLGAIGIPVYDRINPARIWALRRTSVSFNCLSYSDNWGDSWIDYVVLNTTTTFPYVQTDRAGNFYYGNSVGLYKINQATLAQTQVITWSPTAEGSWGYTNWAWGEDSSGNFYTAGYHLSQPGYQRLWKSMDGGNAWSCNDTLINNYPTEKHIHSLRCIPDFDIVYISFGDGVNRGLVRSADGFDTFSSPIIQSPAGPTCISYSDEGVYTFTDVAGDTNYIDLIALDGLTTSHAFTLQYQGHLAAIYFGALVGTDEMWCVTRSDTDIPNQFASVFQLKKHKGRGNAWRMEQVLATHDKVQDSVEYFGLAHDGTGIIPESANYIFVGYKNKSEAIDTWGLLRILRKPLVC